MTVEIEAVHGELVMCTLCSFTTHSSHLTMAFCPGHGDALISTSLPATGIDIYVESPIVSETERR